MILRLVCTLTFVYTNPELVSGWAAVGFKGGIGTRQQFLEATILERSILL